MAASPLTISKSSRYLAKAQISVPPFRPDIEGTADIFEEIVRIYGYDKIEPKSVIKDDKFKTETLSNNLKSFYKSKRIIASRGYLETITWSFISTKYATLDNTTNAVQIKNPISNDLDRMRTSIFPNLLNSININIGRLHNNGKLFEVGPQFFGLQENDQQMMATAIQYGPAYNPIWNNEKRDSDAFDVKSDVYFVLDQLNIPTKNILYDELDNIYFHPGKSAQLRIGKNILARFGEIHPFILQKYEIKTKVYGFEIFLDQLNEFQAKKSSTKKAFDNNDLQAVERDFSFLLPKSIKVIEVVKKIQQIDKKIIKKVLIFDVFEDKKNFSNMKSVAFKIILQPIDKTFTDIEIENISNLIINLVSKNFDGQLRQ